MQTLKKPRNFSFKDKDPDNYDNIEVNGVNHIVPAPIGSTYWAILKVLYINFDKLVYLDQLLKEVEELMIDRDEIAWNEYVNKKETSVYSKITGTTVVKKVSSWQKRIFNNARTLTRLGGNSKYGERIFEKCHKLKLNYDSEKKPYFVLTNLF